MLKLTLAELILRLIPEGLLMILGIYAFSKTRIDVRRYLLASTICAASIFLVRNLPITYGIHTIIGSIAIIVVAVTIVKFEIVDAIKGIVITLVIQFASETINVLLIENIIGLNMEELFTTAANKVLYGVPSILIWAAIVGIYYFYLYKRKELKVIEY